MKKEKGNSPESLSTILHNKNIILLRKDLMISYLFTGKNPLHNEKGL